MRRDALRMPALLALGAITMAGCGSASLDPAEPPVTGGQELVGYGVVLQSAGDAAPEFCVGGVMTSLPPQCGGPALAGEFSWDDVESESLSGVRWTDASYFGVGHYDKEMDTFTLTRPMSASPPDGYVMAEEEPRQFPQLCDDPFRGGDPQYEDPGSEKQNALQGRLESLDGYVDSYVSDGANMVNVRVTGDPEAAHAQLREIWPGGLCVVHHEAPTMRVLMDAQQALHREHTDLGILSSWPDTDDGRLAVHVLLADVDTITRIHEAVSGQLTPDQVAVTSAFQPLP